VSSSSTDPPIAPESAATLLLSLLTGLGTHQLVDPELDVATPFAEFVRVVPPDR
jgi:hypothetical protein